MPFTKDLPEEERTPIGPLTFTNPYMMGSIGPQVRVDIQLTSLIDPYDYHDFPLSAEWYMGKDELLQLKKRIEDLLEKMEGVSNA